MMLEELNVVLTIILLGCLIIVLVDSINKWRRALTPKYAGTKPAFPLESR